ncbi:hypothetical protein CFP56_011567 [Quercus suber]|uniref:PGG domain-containing protein n=1 Tax=Quercus suber TaxID=58331 RepID=A0AAW0M412_QUESU
MAANFFLENDEINYSRVLNWQDNEGNTVLHILVSKNETQAVRHLFSWCKKFVEVNRTNLECKTAWDILRQDNREIRDVLRRAGAKPGSPLSTFNGYPNQTMSTSLRREIRRFTEERRSMLLVVAALLSTLSFQAILTPPGGVWQDNGLCINYDQNNKTVGSSNYPEIIYLSMSKTKLASEHKAGTAIALQDRFFPLFLYSQAAKLVHGHGGSCAGLSIVKEADNKCVVGPGMSLGLILLNAKLEDERPTSVLGLRKAYALSGYKS